MYTCALFYVNTWTRVSQLTTRFFTIKIHRNLLRPFGVRLVPATLIVRVFCAEDLPQMDPGYFEGVKKLLHIGTAQKELVDPYCTVTFAGHKEKTQVIWNARDPKWNKQINLGVRVSHHCNDILMRFHDKIVTM